VLFFGAFGAAWDDAMAARWSAHPLATLWPEMDAAFVAAGGGAAASHGAAAGGHHRCRIESSDGKGNAGVQGSGIRRHARRPLRTHRAHRQR
jgi:hypothetical protein